MSYYLSYEKGISKKVEKPAFAIGSAVHWGIEHNTEDLSDYWGPNADYGHDQILSEAMVHGYLKHKTELFDKLLTDPVTGEKLTLEDEYHELKIAGKLKSRLHSEPHDFVGIIDLLLLTNKGFILIDYKTSSRTPYWDDYLNQIYRYIFLLKSEFPDVPIVKIGIINIRKTSIRQKKSENASEFLNRMKFEYELNDEDYVNYHEYNMIDLDETRVDDYLKNLTIMADAGETMVNNKTFFINYSAANGQYGKSDFWDIFYHTPDAHLLYKIRDYVWSDEENDFVESRDCVPIDMELINLNLNILNKYDDFEQIVNGCDGDFAKALYICQSTYQSDESLLQMYVETYKQKQLKKS